ncbi:hypothetical protein K458DRAFT_377244 [Lentithecium fluviatile CBS 122367]|uniref:Uncharacterized protein n=1 Tax=Lentithecium fluviatile CBS 122367 TaxID=1168545 RepID=A0A6G1IJM9_9PLEO|nr:hypothetical protein K458DRAFT_377244 [Lentithecium fluviatile CBS 122367]
MCKVTQYQFTCYHYLKLCKSRCGGTKEKKTRNNNAKAACCSGAYINIKLPYACSKCQQDSWLGCWKGKLERAIAFRNGLYERNSPGAEEVAALVKDLEERFETAAWDVHKLLPAAHNKASIERVKPAVKEERELRRKASLLQQEVQPHEVVLPDEEKRGWIENDDDDEEFVRSTDPFHPVSTDYSHPLDNADDSWLLEHFTEEELQSQGTGEFDHSWEWGSEWNTPEQETEPINEWSSNNTPEASTSQELIAWGPDAAADSSTAELGLDGLRTEEVIKSFWEVVNMDSKADRNSTTQERPQHPTPSLSPNGSPEIRSRTLPRRISTQLKYDKMRQIAQQWKCTEPEVYYAKWLLLSRMEIRDFVGAPQGRRILDPK